MAASTPGWLSCGFYVPLHSKRSFGTFSQPISCLNMEKLHLTQQKHTFTNQKKCTATQNKQKKTEVRFSRLLRHPAWKRTGPILALALHKFVTYLLTAQDPHGASTPVHPRVIIFTGPTRLSIPKLQLDWFQPFLHSSRYRVPILYNVH